MIKVTLYPEKTWKCITCYLVSSSVVQFTVCPLHFYRNFSLEIPGKVRFHTLLCYRPCTKYDGRLYLQFVCQSTPGGGGVTQSPSHNTSTVPMSFLGGTPSPSNNTSTGPMFFPGGTLGYAPPTRSGQGDTPRWDTPQPGHIINDMWQ